MPSDGKCVAIRQMTKRREKKKERYFGHKASKMKTCQMMRRKKTVTETARFTC